MTKFVVLEGKDTPALWLETIRLDGFSKQLPRTNSLVGVGDDHGWDFALTDEDTGYLISFITAQIEPSGIHLYNVCTLKKFHKRGYMNYLLNRVKEFLASKNHLRIHIRVFENNSGAITAYEKLGFKKTIRRKVRGKKMQFFICDFSGSVSALDLRHRRR